MQIRLPGEQGKEVGTEAFPTKFILGYYLAGIVTTVFSSAESEGIMFEIFLCSLSSKNVKPRGLYLYQRFPVMYQRQQESNCRQLIILLHNSSYSWRLLIQLITLKPYCIQIIPLATAMPKFQLVCWHKRLTKGQCCEQHFTSIEQTLGPVNDTKQPCTLCNLGTDLITWTVR